MESVVADRQYDAAKGDSVDFAISVLGFVALLTPLALWVSWSTTVFYLVLVVGLGACLTIAVLTKIYPERRYAPAPTGDNRRR